MNSQPLKVITSVAAVVPAAGSGSRMGAGMNKVLLPVEGVPVLVRTLRVLFESGVIDRSVVVAAASEVKPVRELLACFAFPDQWVMVTAGGSSRQESVSNGCLCLTESAPATTHIVVHDAARCLLTPALVHRCVEEAVASGACTAAVPVVDSVVRQSCLSASESDAVAVSRDDLWLIQTPQVFEKSLLLKAHRSVAELEVSGRATDDASLVRRLHKVAIVTGERTNIKLTTPEDIEFARRLLKSENSVSSVVELAS